MLLFTDIYISLNIDLGEDELISVMLHGLA